MLLTMPLWGVAAVAIKLDSPGPVFFVQYRVGRGGHRFRFLKFRSMFLDAEARLVQVAAGNELSGPAFKMRSDPRITRVGRWIRRTSIDELPQFINVIRGEMSIVGPRPPLPSEVERYRPEDSVRLAVKPGMTCLWQVNGRSHCMDFDRWMAYDRDYVDRVSLWLDLSIILRTFWAVASCRGAW